MRFIIDTHAFIWFVNDSDNLSNDARFVIESEADLWISSASLWEIAIKVSLGKLILPKTLSSLYHKTISNQRD